MLNLLQRIKIIRRYAKLGARLMSLHDAVIFEAAPTTMFVLRYTVLKPDR